MPARVIAHPTYLRSNSSGEIRGCAPQSAITKPGSFLRTSCSSTTGRSKSKFGNDYYTPRKARSRAAVGSPPVLEIEKLHGQACERTFRRHSLILGIAIGPGLQP